MQYRGSGNFKKTVLAKKGNEIKVVILDTRVMVIIIVLRLGSPILHDSSALETKAGGLPRMTNSRQTIGLESSMGGPGKSKKSLPKDDTLYGKQLRESYKNYIGNLNHTRHPSRKRKNLHPHPNTRRV